MWSKEKFPYRTLCECPTLTGHVIETFSSAWLESKDVRKTSSRDGSDSRIENRVLWRALTWWVNWLSSGLFASGNWNGFPLSPYASIQYSLPDYKMFTLSRLREFNSESSDMEFVVDKAKLGSIFSEISVSPLISHCTKHFRFINHTIIRAILSRNRVHG